jgi:hypothetical protein
MEINLPVYLVGLLTSILTEIIKIFPAIGDNDFAKSLVAIIVIAIGAFLTVGLSWVNFFTVMGWAFINYKMLVQPFSAKIGLQKE